MEASQDYGHDHTGTRAPSGRGTGNTTAESSRRFPWRAAYEFGKLLGRVDRLSHRVGEDYFYILSHHPLIMETMARRELLLGDRELLDTTFNIPWSTTLFWSAAAGGTTTLRQSITRSVSEIVHDSRGHVPSWDQVNQFMDRRKGRYHRLKFGHSIGALPEIVDRFGVKGVPAFLLHIAQDFTTTDGIPTLPNAWAIKQWLEARGVSKGVASGLVSANFASVVAAMATLELMHTLARLSVTISKSVEQRSYLKVAAKAIETKAWSLAEANCQQVLSVSREPRLLMVLGQVYAQQSANWLKAHRCFEEVLKQPTCQPGATLTYEKARISLRGLAGTQALSTSAVLSGIHADHWNAHLQELVTDTVFAFRESADSLKGQARAVVPHSLLAPPYLSAAMNYYLAARSACYYPFMEEREELVKRNTKAMLECLGRVHMHDPNRLEEHIKPLRELWVRELLPVDEAELLLSTH